MIPDTGDMNFGLNANAGPRGANRFQVSHYFMNTNGFRQRFQLRLLRLASVCSAGIRLFGGLILGPKSEAGLATKIAHLMVMLAPSCTSHQ